MEENQSLSSVDSEYDMGSIQQDLNFLEDTPSLKEMVLANQPAPRMTPPFIGLRPTNPAMQALASHKREAHNRSPVGFREGRRASDTSLTQGEWHSRVGRKGLAPVGFLGRLSCLPACGHPLCAWNVCRKRGGGTEHSLHCSQTSRAAAAAAADVPGWPQPCFPLRLLCFPLPPYRNRGLSAAPSESGPHQRDPGAEQGPAAVRADEVGERAHLDSHLSSPASPREWPPAGISLAVPCTKRSVGGAGMAQGNLNGGLAWGRPGQAFPAFCPLAGLDSSRPGPPFPPRRALLGSLSGAFRGACVHVQNLCLALAVAGQGGKAAGAPLLSPHPVWDFPRGSPALSPGSSALGRNAHHSLQRPAVQLVLSLPRRRRWWWQHPSIRTWPLRFRTACPPSCSPGGRASRRSTSSTGSRYDAFALSCGEAQGCGQCYCKELPWWVWVDAGWPGRLPCRGGQWASPPAWPGPGCPCLMLQTCRRRPERSLPQCSGAPPTFPSLPSFQKPSLLSKAQNACQVFCKELPRSLEQQLQEHR